MSRKLIRKMLSVFLSAVLAVSAVSSFGLGAFAVSDFTYTAVNSTTVQITGYNGTAKNVVIPSVIDGKSVTAIAASAFANSTIESVTVPSSVTNIALKAFLDCKKLETVIIENGTISIGNCAFYGCLKLSDIKLPATLRSIGVCAFTACRELTAVYLPESVTNVAANAFENSAVQSIIGHEGSYAQTYANANGFNFIEYSLSLPNRIYSTVDEATAGESVTVPIKIANNSGLAGFDIKLSYDKDVLTPVEVLPSNEISLNGLLENTIGTSKTEGVIDIVWSGSDSMTDNGTLFSVVFSVNPDAQGVTDIGVSFVQNNTFDEDIEDVALNCSDISIAISSDYDGLADVKLTAQNVVAGEILTVTGTLSGQKRVSSYTFDIAFDDNNFDFVSVSSAASNPSAVSSTDGHIRFTLNSVAQTYNNKAIFTLTLKSKDTATSGKYTLAGTSPTAHVLPVSINVIPSSTSDIVKLYSDKVIKNNGSTVLMPLYFENNKGIMGYKIRVTYDSSLLRPVNVTGEDGGTLDNNIGIYDGYFDILWNSTENSYINGRVLIVEFETVSSETAVTQIDISYSRADTFNENNDDVVMNCSGAQAVINALMGDVDFNGVVNPADYAEIRSYVFCLKSLTDAQKAVSDFDCDGTVDAFDAVYLDLLINHAISQ